MTEPPKSSATTQELLLTAAAATLQTKGVKGISARAIAASADVNQALIFYHFGTVDALVAAAGKRLAAATISEYAEQLSSVTSLGELLALGRQIHDQESARGSVTVMAQLFAAGQNDPALAAVVRDMITVWTSYITEVLERLLSGSPIAELADTAGLARAVSAAFVGLELYQGIDPDGSADAFAALAKLTVLVDLLNDLGPLERRTLRKRLAKADRVPRE